MTPDGAPRLRILHVPHAYAPVIGGAELICQRISEVLASRGHTVRVVTSDAGAVQSYYEFGIARVGPRHEVRHGVEVCRLPYAGAWYRLGGALDARPWPALEPLRRSATSYLLRALRAALGRRLAREIHSFCPDVVMALPHLVATVEHVLAARRRRSFPLVLVPMLHEEDPQWPVAAIRSAMHSADAVVALTGHEATRLERGYGVPADRIFLAPGGVDLPQEPGPWPRPPTVLFLGRKVLTKGIDVLLEAMRHVWRERPDAELVLAGIRVPETRAIDLLVAALPEAQRHRVRSVDNVSADDKAQLLRSAHCLVLASRVESFGAVILEAWAHGTPPVTLDLPVFADIITPEETGVLVPLDGPEALATAIGRLLANPDRAQAMGQRGRDRAAARYGWAAITTTYERAYLAAIARWRS